MEVKMNKKVNYWVVPCMDKLRTAEGYLNKVCNEFNLTTKQLRGRSRKREIVDARSILMHLLYMRLNMTSTEAGKYLNRDHSTVLYNCKKVNNLMDVDRDFKELVNKFI